MTMFAPHRDTLECYVDCITAAQTKDTLTRLLAEDVVAVRPFGDEQSPAARPPWSHKDRQRTSSTTPIWRSSAVETHHRKLPAASRDAAVHGIFFVRSTRTAKIAEVSMFYRTLRPAWRYSATLRCNTTCSPGNCARMGSDA